ncbi:MAG: FMN-binding protein [Gemmatimonadota bacterium]|nr:FMN-binding protein [Gemmatimonadota bacterium]
MSVPATPPEGGRPRVASARLISTLAVAGALAGLAIVFVHQWSEPRIQAHRAAALAAAIDEVLGGPESYRTLWVGPDGLTPELPPGADSTGTDRVYLGEDAEGRPAGFAVEGEKPGYQDVVGLIFGYDPAAGEVIGMKVLESKETPGLGDKIEKDSSFVREFRGVATPLKGVKPGAGTDAASEVDMISGATISSRTVIEIINERLAVVGPLIEAYASSGGPLTAGSGAGGVP